MGRARRQSTQKKSATRPPTKFAEVLHGFFKNFAAGKGTEDGADLVSQAPELIAGGWEGVGYMMVAPEPHNGLPFGRKKAAFTPQWLSSWMAGSTSWSRLVSHAGGGSTSHQKTLAAIWTTTNSSPYVVHRKTYHGRDVVVEFIPNCFDGSMPKKTLDTIAQTLTAGMGIARVAEEMALQCDMVSLGVQRSKRSLPVCPRRNVGGDGRHAEITGEQGRKVASGFEFAKQLVKLDSLFALNRQRQRAGGDEYHPLSYCVRARGHPSTRLAN